MRPTVSIVLNALALALAVAALIVALTHTTHVSVDEHSGCGTSNPWCVAP